jgi:hypothetical protein
LVVALGALALALAAGCGDSDEDQVRDTLRRFERATAAGDYRELCKDLLAKRLVQRLDSVGLPCEIALRKGFGGVRRPGIDVQRVKVKGDTAFAVVTATAVGQRPARETIRLVKEDDSWRVAALARPQPPAPPRELK